MKVNTLDEQGFYIADHIEGDLPSNWTADLVGNGYYAAQYQSGIRNKETGEWTRGKWTETGGPSTEDIEFARQKFIVVANYEKSSLMSHASDMIGALSDEIEALEDNNDDIPEKLRTDLKAWKQYRVSSDPTR